MKRFSKIIWIVLLAAVLQVAGTLAQTPDRPSFTIKDGEISCAKDHNGDIQCLGLPYARPPVGDLRFKQPTQEAKWSTLRDATHFASECLQAKTEYSKAQSGSEDCLYLNVYIPKSETHEPLATMVWLHGGGFINGSGNAFNGKFLASASQTIVVTVNYRLGPLGWLALPSLAKEDAEGRTGNYGLLDSVAALKWVKENIASLGGNANRVTLFGQSAGGEQVLALLASPYGRSLFDGAIVMSAPAAVAMPNLAQAAAKRTDFLRELGCQDEARQAACLRAKSGTELLAASHESWNLIHLLGLQWTPTVDGNVLPDQWLNIFRRGNFNHVPVIIGHAKQEGRLFVVIDENARQAKMNQERYDDRTLKFFGPMAYVVRSQYDREDLPTPGDRTAQIVVDALFAEGLSQDRLAIEKHAPVYGYQSCDANAPESHVHALYSTINCAHDSDLPLLFQWDDFKNQPAELSKEQTDVAIAMAHYWGNFARTGDPNGPDVPLWPQYERGNVQLLETASLGGVRSQLPDSYRSEHSLALWDTLAFIKHALAWSGYVVIGLLAFIILAFRTKWI